MLASIHNIQAEVPAESIVAMFDTARELNHEVIGGFLSDRGGWRAPAARKSEPPL